MRLPMLCLAVALWLATAGAAQSPAARSDVLAQVRIPTTVRANGQMLSSGTYDLRLGGKEEDRTGVTDAQQPVEFVDGGAVVARDVAEILRDTDLPAVGASAQPAASGVRVDLLKGGEFLRISVKRDGIRYLIHLPVVH